MITTYALSLTTADCNEEQRIALIDVVSDWMLLHYPLDARGPGTSVRVTRESSDDPVFRMMITESGAASTHVETLTITVVLLSGVLTFDIRILSTPTTSKVVPYTPQLVPPRIARLVRDVLTTVPTEDANQFITDSVHVASTELDGQNIAAFIDAPSRRLPVVVEIGDYERHSALLLAVGAGPLVGLAHIFHITGAEALRGFESLSRYSLLGPGCVIVQWAGKTEPEIVHTRELPSSSLPRERHRLVRLILDTAARSIASPRVPPPPRTEYDIIDSSSRGSSDGGGFNEDQAIHIEQLEASVNELEASMADADRLMAELREQLEKKGGQVDELILRNVSLEIQAGQTPKVLAVPSMTEALRLAKENCPFLVFHDRAIESGSGLEGPEPVSVLQDLVRLNEVARAWMSGEISGTSIKLACRQMGLDFVASISDTARQKYEEDYLIEWRGRAVRAEAHLRRGRKTHLVRIHVFFDDETQQVVVAYIGRHLRDKGSAS
jgi:hypothetical protein